MCQEGLNLALTCFSDFSSYLLNTKPASGGTYYIVACLEVTQGTPPRTELLLLLMLEAWKPLMTSSQGSRSKAEAACWILLKNIPQRVELFWDFPSLVSVKFA